MSRQFEMLEPLCGVRKLALAYLPRHSRTSLFDYSECFAKTKPHENSLLCLEKNDLRKRRKARKCVYYNRGRRKNLNKVSDDIFQQRPS
ncbi:unnamed protein product [Rhizophagus irregularis]|nr:unnamed protein product [Rhizophagus irregularis]